MYRGAKLYKNVWLAPGSESLKLYTEGKFEALDKLLKECDAAKRKLEGSNATAKGN